MDICSETNVEEFFQRLSKELNILGFPKVLYQSSNEKQMLVKLANTTWTLAQAQKAKNIKLGEQNEMILKFSCERKNLESTVKQLEKTVAVKVNMIEKMQDSLTKTLSEKDSLIKDVKKLKLELTKLNSSMSTQRLQSKNEFRKQKAKLENLQAHLFKLIRGDPSTYCDRPFYDSFSTQNEAALQEEVINKCICRLDENIQMLLTENASIRATILKVYSELSNMNNCLHKNEPSKNKKILPEHLFTLPVEELLQKVEADFELIIMDIMKQLNISDE